MAGWHSLSGYLYCKPTGAFSRFKTKKKQWYIFEESKSQLLYYQSKQDARTKEPQGAIDIQGSSISLNLEENNQFVITSDSKEYILQADNHESMMIWLLGLQAKRDACVNKGLESLADKNQHKKLSRRHTMDTFNSKKRVSEPVAVPWPEELDSRNLFRTSSAKTRRGTDTGFLLTAGPTGGDSSNDSTPRVIRRGLGRSPTLGQTDSVSMVANAGCAIAEEEDEAKRLDEMKLSLSQSFTTGLARLTHKETEEEASSESDGDDVFNYERLEPESMTPQSVLANHDVATPTIVMPGCDSKNTSMDSGIPKEGRSNESLSDDSVIEKEVVPHLKIQELEKELLHSKTELANALNQETCLREMLEKREQTIYELDEKATRLEQIEKHLLEKDKGSLNEALAKTTSQVRYLEEQCRVCQNQNRFLNEEVRKLTHIRQLEQEQFRKQAEQIRELEMEIEHWKRDYVFLLQSNITVPTGDVTDGFELNLYGGDRHKERLIDLLEEARSKNPGLPTFEKLTQSEYHVDRYGFKHTHENDSLLLHYICRQLHEHYTHHLSSHEDHQLEWRAYLKAARSSIVKTKELKTLCRAGIPAQYRSEVWRMLIHSRIRDVIQVKGQHYYTNISNQIQESEVAGSHRKQISLDLLRTLPTNIHFDHNDADGIKKLQEVLQAFTIHNPEIGYCQGMNFIAGMALLFLDKEDAFWCLVALTEKYFPAHYFNSNLIGAQADQLVLKDLLAEKLPHLHKHLHDIDIDISTITLNWFLAVYFDAVPFETLVRIWDAFLLEGPKVLFRFAVAILQIHERVLLQQSDTISIWKHLKLAAKLTFDVEGLVKVAIEELKPFKRRREINAKQVCYMNTLLELEKSRLLKRKAFHDTEKKLSEMENVNYNKPLIQSVTCFEDGKLWLCHGEQNSARLSVIDCQTNLMHDLCCEFDSRIMCICALNEEVVLLGSLAKNLYAFHTGTKEKLWQVRLHDTIMDLSMACGDDCKQNKVFAALADGTIAVLENVSAHEPMGNIFYIPIGYSPVASILLVNQELWCACSNTVQILHANTLDQKDRFRISNNPFDHILTLKQGLHGVWIAVKGSSIVELWDENTLTCRLLYDVKENKYPRSKRDDDAVFNPMRVTSLLPYNNMIWVGTGTGDLSVYEIIERSGALQSMKYSRSNSHTCSQRRGPSSGQTTTTRRSGDEENIRGWMNGPTSQRSHVRADSLSGSGGLVSNGPIEDEDKTPTATPKGSPARRAVHKMSRTTQTPPSQIQRKVILSKRQVVDSETGDSSDSQAEQNIAKIFDMNFNKDIVEKTKDGLHLEIFLQVQEDEPMKETFDKAVGTENLTVPFLAIEATLIAKDTNEDLSVTTTNLAQGLLPLAAAIQLDESETIALEDYVESSAVDPGLGLLNVPVSGVQGQSGDSASVRSLSPISEKSESTRNSFGDSPGIVGLQGDSKTTNNILIESSSGEEDRDMEHHETTSPKGDSSGFEASAEESPQTQRSPSKCYRGSDISSPDDSPEDGNPDIESDTLYDLDLQLVVRNKVAESPIRCLVQTMCQGEYVIISCSSKYEEDEAVLKWKRGTHEKIWTNEPIFHVCHQTKTVQLPAYMKHRLSMSSSD